MCEYLDMLEKRGWEKGIKEGERKGVKKGEYKMGKLVQLLLAEKKYGEIEAAARDREKRLALYRQYGIL